MAETVGLIKEIKLGSWLAGSINAFDICLLTVQEAAGGKWTLFLWNSRADAPTIDRILQTQRLALAREAALQKLTVRLVHGSASSIVDHIKVEFP